jgi:hypothetical protein
MMQQGGWRHEDINTVTKGFLAEAIKNNMVQRSYKPGAWNSNAWPTTLNKYSKCPPLKNKKEIKINNKSSTAVFLGSPGIHQLPKAYLCAAGVPNTKFQTYCKYIYVYIPPSWGIWRERNLFQTSVTAPSQKQSESII